MSKLQISDQKLKPVKKLLEKVNMDEDRIIVSDHSFYSNSLELIIGDKFYDDEVRVELEAEQVNEIIDDFIPIDSELPNPEFTYMKYLANNTEKRKLLNEIRDVIVFRASTYTNVLQLA